MLERLLTLRLCRTFSPYNHNSLRCFYKTHWGSLRHKVSLKPVSLRHGLFRLQTHLLCEDTSEKKGGIPGYRLDPKVAEALKNEGLVWEAEGQVGGKGIGPPRADKLAIMTCGECQTRFAKAFSTASYERGLVIVQCPGCMSLHLVADNIGWFRDGITRLDQLVKEAGSTIKTVDADGLAAAIEALHEHPNATPPAENAAASSPPSALPAHCDDPDPRRRDFDEMLMRELAKATAKGGSAEISDSASATTGSAATMGGGVLEVLGDENTMAKT